MVSIAEPEVIQAREALKKINKIVKEELNAEGFDVENTKAMAILAIKEGKSDGLIWGWCSRKDLIGAALTILYQANAITYEQGLKAWTVLTSKKK